MRNDEFRALLTSSSSKPPPRPENGRAAQSASPSSRTAALGSRTHPSIPMTPRSILGNSNSRNEFARQVAEHERTTAGQPTAKRFKSSVPKGTRLGEGYQDRAALLRQQGETQNGSHGDDKANRLEALEDMVKLQQIDQATFERLRDEIGVGGEVGSTHLVKGLDWKLLERVKRGEDVLAATRDKATEEADATAPEIIQAESEKHQVDEELGNLLEKEVQAVKREKKIKRGEMAPPSERVAVSGKMSRDQILKSLKASRAAAAKEVKEAKSPQVSLSTKFRKVGSDHQGERKKLVETVHGRRREVLVITHSDGTTKRKVKWIDKEDGGGESGAHPTVKPVIGMAVPVEMAAKRQALLERQRQEEEDDNDIFAGVGATYNPLGDMSDESETDSDPQDSEEVKARQGEAETKPGESMSKPRNYFSTGGVEDEGGKLEGQHFADPNILAALKRAAAIRKAQENAEAETKGGNHEINSHDHSFLERLKKREREDAADVDLGFGESRFAEEDDEESQMWEGNEKKHERKRGAKKAKGNKEDVGDVLAVLGRGKT